MKKKVYSKVFTLVALSAIGVTGIAGAVTVKKDNSVISAHAQDKVQVALTQFGLYGWNNRGDGTLLQFDQSINGGVVDTTNQVTATSDLGAKMTLNGVSVKDLSGIVMDCGTLGAGNVYLKVPSTLLTPTADYPYPVLHIPAGTEFYDVLLPEITLTFFDNVWGLSGYGAPTTTFKNFPNGWNNRENGDSFETQLSFINNVTPDGEAIFTNLASAPYDSDAASSHKVYSISRSMKLDGVPVRDLVSSYPDITINSTGLSYLHFKFPKTLIKEGSVLHFDQGVQFHKVYLPELEFKMIDGTWVYQPILRVGTPDVTFSGVHSSWNNADATGVWGLTSDYNLTILEFAEEIAPVEVQYGPSVTETQSLLASITLGDKTLAELGGSTTVHFNDGAGFTSTKQIAIALPKSASTVGAELSIPEGLYFAGHFLPKINLKIFENDKFGSVAEFGTPNVLGATINAFNNNVVPTGSTGIKRALFQYTSGEDIGPNSTNVNLTWTGVGENILLNGKSIKQWALEYPSLAVGVTCHTAFGGNKSFYVDYPEAALDSINLNVLEILGGLKIVNGFVEAKSFVMNIGWGHTSWLEGVKVSFDGNDGEVNGASYYGFLVTQPKFGDAIASHTASKTGYVFNGWLLNGNPVDPQAIITGDAKLVADYLEAVTVSFDAEGVSPQVIGKGQKATKPSDPVKQGAHFDGWYTDGTYASEFNFNNTISVDTTVYAKFIDCVDGEIVYSEPTADHKITATLYCGIDTEEVLATETATGVYSQDSAATCEDGETGHYTYTFANAKFETQTENVVLDNALGHDYGDPVVTWDGKTATATMTCSHDDSHKITETKDGTFVEDTPATCTSKNLGHYEVTFDNTDLGSARTDANSVEGDVPATGHDWSVEVTWDGKFAEANATCEHTGCQETLYEKKEATYVKDTDATCHSYETGHYEVTFDNTELGSAQTDANSVINTDAEKPSHIYGDPDYDWTAIDGGFECVATQECENSGCDEVKTEIGVVTSEVTKEPSCTEKGERTYTAAFETIESATKVVEIPALGHDVETIDGEPATCKEDGYKEAYYCNNCKLYYEDEACESLIGDFEDLEAWRLGEGKLAKEDVQHTPAEAVIENVVAPTCTEAGSYDEVVYCSVCGEEISRTPVVDPALGHDMSPVAGKAATCKEDGYKAAFFCETCEKYFEDEAGASLIGDASAYAAWKLGEGKLAKEDVQHTPAAAVKENVVKPTCTEAGSHDEVVYCSVCGEEISRTPVVDAALGHTPAEAVRENIVEPTCTEAGSYDEVVYCSVCGEELSRTKIDLPATGHVWGEGEVTKPATCTENGVKTFTCECGETKTEVIPATGHKLGELIPEVAATTEKEGMKAHYVCSECGQYFDANKMACTAESLVIPKLEPQPEPKKGCGGSVIAASAVVTGLAIAGAALIAAKKKED